MQLVQGKNPISKGTVLFQEGEQMEWLAILLAGKILIKNKCYRIVKAQGTFLGLADLQKGVYSSDYMVMEDAVVLALPIYEKEPIRSLIAKNNDYRAIMISSQCKHFIGLYRIYESLQKMSESLYNFVKTSYRTYQEIHQRVGIPTIEISAIDELQTYDSSIDIVEEQVHFYEEASRIPLSINKTYFAYSEDMVVYLNEILTNYINQCVEECNNLLEYTEQIVELLNGSSGRSLFEYSAMLGRDLKREGKIDKELIDSLQGIVEQLSEVEHVVNENTMTKVSYPIDEMKETVRTLASKELSAEEQAEKEAAEALVQRDFLTLKDSMQQIIDFSGLEEETLTTFKEAVEFFVHASDRLSVEDDMKKQKKNITNGFFPLYQACYYKKLSSAKIPAAVKLFLNYGYVDERLLTEEQLLFLCGVEEEKEESGPCHVYTMCEWLDAIRNGEKDPSKSEFDEDYVESLRTMRKQGEITEEEQKQLLNDMGKRVDFEINNMFKCNDRTCYGQPSSYVPILYKDVLYGYMDKLLVTKKKLNESVERLNRLDYSVFYREVIYSNAELNIVNDSVMKNVFPDIIMIPVYGINASMWQEISGRSKQTPGRFLFPALSGTNIDDLMLKMFGRFHWELCRCVMGMAWNDVKTKSLTSEYMDYIQFYRKNREISEEWRDKIKLQIQKARNNSREIFLIDYENWMRNESNASMKLNKVAREILATYVPFNKEYRDKLGVQRPYEVAMARYGRNMVKKKQELDLKLKAIRKVTEDIPEEIMDTYRYFTEN